jgi:SAM-dependent methyltransferase
VSRNVGTGAGEITPDGCAVDFYALLPAMGEPEVVHAAVPGGASILELGCGTGRILRPLAELGHPVLGVDESPAMLAHLAGLPSVCSAIETLRLERTFDAVLLASQMLNTEPAQRRAFLAACRRHVDPLGTVVVQQAAPGSPPGPWPARHADRRGRHGRRRPSARSPVRVLPAPGRGRPSGYGLWKRRTNDSASQGLRPQASSRPAAICGHCDRRR